MTREEAARIIKKCKEKGFKYTFYTLEEYYTALDMAIKELEQEPKTDTWSIKDVADTLAKHGLIVEQEPCEDWHDIPSGEMTLEQARQAVRELRKYVMDNHILSKSGDTISRQAAIDALEKCYTCKHVYQRVSDADTLYCRCRKGCRYEEVKPRRSGESPRRHEG